ncbi:MAG: acyltransferase [Chthonomonas sp.]|nr:acyltransferase [Chthonomonas sp.]
MNRSDYFARLRAAGVSLPMLLIREVLFKLAGKRIRADHRVQIRGLKNIQTKGHLEIATEYVGFMSPREGTWVNVQGEMVVNDFFALGRGCRVDVAPGGKLILHGGRVTANTTFIATSHVEIGRGCTISWGVEFLDTDFHTLSYDGKTDRDPSIVIGERAWIGAHAKILKGVRIGNGCVIAANSVVTKSFDGDNLLIGGNPARVLRENVSWQ